MASKQRETSEWDAVNSPLDMSSEKEWRQALMMEVGIRITRPLVVRQLSYIQELDSGTAERIADATAELVYEALVTMTALAETLRETSAMPKSLAHAERQLAALVRRSLKDRKRIALAIDPAVVADLKHRELQLARVVEKRRGD